MLEDTDDMGADILAAMNEVQGVQAPEPADIKVAPETEPVVEVEKTANRDEAGKFVAKPKEGAQDTSDQPSAAVAEPPSKDAIRIPASWSPDAKAEFAKLSPAVQRAVSKRELEIEHGLRKKDEDVKRYEPLEQVIAPHRQKWAVQGVDEATAVKSLLAASDWLDRDPTTALQHLAERYGVNLASVSGQPQAQPGAGTIGQPQAQPNPVNAELQALQQRLERFERAEQERSQASFQSQIDSFWSDPANIYAENVRQDMASILQSGMAHDLPTAYQKAIWARDDIRPFLLQEQRAGVLATTKAKTDAARNAGVSVTGSPGNGSLPPSSGSIEDDVRRAVQDVQGRA